MTEEDVKNRFITPALNRSGWGNDRIFMEYSFTDGRVIVAGRRVSRGSRKKADYLLFGFKNRPLAVVEAKDLTHEPGSGMQQAMEYAKILDVPFAYSSNGDKFVEHDFLEGTERVLPMDCFPSPDELWERYCKKYKISGDKDGIIKTPYHFAKGSKSPRYYQRIAINRTFDAIAFGKNRILLVMATGTGKTYTAFQIIYRYLQNPKNKPVLYLADRNILIDQTIANDFAPISRLTAKISGSKIQTSYRVYLSLYHQLAGEDGEEPFRMVSPDFFGLIIVDECHRGSARDESLWRKILDYFKGAVQIGLTATPKETKDISNIDYFGEPVYTYSLKQGIEDGFLAPYKVLRVLTDVGTEGWRPSKGEKDINGNEIPDDIYTGKDFDRTIIIDEYTKFVAKRISDFLKSTDRFAKTIVFCVDIDHAERMRRALINENSDIGRAYRDYDYVVRITGDTPDGKKQLEPFIDVETRFPTIVTSSKLMTTGVDCKTCKLIVIDTVINSTIEFKQIIGRGTRLFPENGKNYFTIMDFRGASELFARPDFDGDPISIKNVKPDESFPPDDSPPSLPDDKSFPPDVGPSPAFTSDSSDSKPVVYHIKGVPVKVSKEYVSYVGSDGKLHSENIVDYSKRNILGRYADLKSFLADWNGENRKKAILEELEKCGVFLENLRELTGIRDIDDFDLICNCAFGLIPVSKTDRVNNVRFNKKFMEKYSEEAQKVLDALLEKYKDTNILSIDDLEVFGVDPFRKMGSPKKILSYFGGEKEYFLALRDLQNQIYSN